MKCWLLAGLLLLFVAAGAQATVRSSENFTLSRDVLIAGGASASAAYQLNAVIGESSAGGSGSTSFSLVAGFSARHAAATGSSGSAGGGAVSAVGGGGGGGCTLAPAGVAVDPLFPILLLWVLLCMMRRRRRH